MSKGNIGIRITSFSLATLITLSMAGCSLKRNDNKEKIITSTTSISETITNISTSDEVLETLNQTTASSMDHEYNKLLKELEKNTKQFDSSVQTILKELVTTIYNNKDNVNEILDCFGFPDVETIINERIIKELKDIKFIYIKTSEDDEYYDDLEKFGGSHYSKKEKGIYVLCEPEEVLHVLAEEIFHSGQTWEEACNEFNTYCLLGEGEANLYSWLLVDGCINPNEYYFYEGKNDNIVNIGYGLGNGYYVLATKYYMYLNALLGYDTIEEFKNTLNSSMLTNKLNEMYGIDGERFYNNILEIIADGSEYAGTKNDQFVKCENTFITCMNVMINGAKSNEEKQNILNKYKYLNQFGYKNEVYDNDGNLIKDGTNDKLEGRKDLLDKLFSISGFSNRTQFDNWIDCSNDNLTLGPQKVIS